MSRHPLNVRLNVETLETRATPAALYGEFGIATQTRVLSDIKGVDADQAIVGAGGSEMTTARIDQTPLRVSLVAVGVIALCVGWDRQIREGRPLRGSHR
jgi:hypothetical protein